MNRHLKAGFYNKKKMQYIDFFQAVDPHTNYHLAFTYSFRPNQSITLTTSNLKPVSIHTQKKIPLVS